MVDSRLAGVDVKHRAYRAASIATVCGAALAATTALAPAVAADLPITKAPAKAPDTFNPFWAEIDALGWTVKGDHLPPLVTASPAGTPAVAAGVLGAPATTVLFGNSSVNNDWRAGGRLQAGYWFDPRRSKGIEVSFFDLEDASTGFAADSNTYPILARPFLNAATSAQDAAFVGFPGLATGTVAVNESSRLLGAGALYRQELGMFGGERISALIGYRYLHSSDKLSIPETVNFAGGSISAADSFNAASNFHGLDLGLAGEWRQGLWTLEWRGKVALGTNLNSAAVNGMTTINAFGVTTTSAGGLLALSSNIGNTSQTRFAAVPELSLKAGYQIAPQWQLFGGYDVMYWTDVQRAGGLIDLTVNPGLVPPAATPGGLQRPQPVFNTSPLLAQGFSFGVRYNY
jgi:hypothetical protein